MRVVCPIVACAVSAAVLLLLMGAAGRENAAVTPSGGPTDHAYQAVRGKDYIQGSIFYKYVAPASVALKVNGSWWYATRISKPWTYGAYWKCEWTQEIPVNQWYEEKATFSFGTRYQRVKMGKDRLGNWYKLANWTAAER